MITLHFFLKTVSSRGYILFSTTEMGIQVVFDQKKIAIL